jgi:hypothetical protein
MDNINKTKIFPSYHSNREHPGLGQATHTQPHPTTLEKSFDLSFCLCTQDLVVLHKIMCKMHDLHPIAIWNATVFSNL